MTAPDFESILKSLHTFPVLGNSYNLEDYIPLDLSVNNADLSAVNVSDASDLEAFIWNYKKRNNAKIAYGGYIEKRSIYNRSSHFNQKLSETERNIHLGLDLWIEADTPIFAPLDGQIHSFKNNTNYGDYGPTIILKHDVNGITFYTLYGHLSLPSLDQKVVGQTIKRGEQIAALGTAEVNGDYPPHLHFQIIKDIQECYGDYPGVSSLVDLEYYKLNCPNPNLLLQTN